MALFKGPVWPNGAVPYRLSNDKATVQGWLDNLNRKIGRKVFIPYLTPILHGTDYIEIQTGNGSESGQVGYGPGCRKVKVEDESRSIHELLHVLGFDHEQYHRNYGWKYYNGMSAYAPLSPPEHTHHPNEWLWNSELSSNLARRDIEFVAWINHRNQPVTEDKSVSDIYSAMMYPTSRASLLLMKASHPDSAQWPNEDSFDFDASAAADHHLDPYDLSTRDKNMICRYYTGHETLGRRARDAWKQQTSLDGPHFRSMGILTPGGLTKVDDALASCDINQIREQFNTWYNNNEKERTKRNRGAIVDDLRKSLLDNWNF